MEGLLGLLAPGMAFGRAHKWLLLERRLFLENVKFEENFDKQMDYYKSQVLLIFTVSLAACRITMET